MLIQECDNETLKYPPTGKSASEKLRSEKNELILLPASHNTFVFAAHLVHCSTLQLPQNNEQEKEV